VWYVAYPGGEGAMITHDLNQYGDVSLTADSSTLVTVQVELLSNIWVVGFNQPTTNVSQLTNGKMDGYCGVTWMPDGKIVYAARKIKYADLWMMGADGGNQKQLTDDQPADRFPSVTPDGRYIIFDSLGQGILRMDSDGGNTKQLTGRGIVPHCSPDGKWVAYQRDPGPSVWKVSIDGGQPVRLTEKITSRPAFSPDGNQIACFYKEERTVPWKLAILPSEGGQPTKVFDNPVNLNRFFVFRWTPDGRAILYVDERGGVGNIWSQPVDGGRPVQVTDFKSDLIYTFDLSRDGKWLAVTRGAVSGDVVMMTALRQ
jgi:Tol biopolymer transport system component